MSINQRQHQQLTEMGISLWQHRPVAFQSTPPIQNNSEYDLSYLELNTEFLNTLIKQTFFTDLLFTLELSIGEITAKKDHLDLGLFNWFFYPDENTNENTDQNTTLSIHCADNKLISPSIELIRKSPALKKQLWQTIMTKLL